MVYLFARKCRIRGGRVSHSLQVSVGGLFSRRSYKGSIIAALAILPAAVPVARATDPLQIRITTSAASVLARGFSGVNQAQPRTGVEYYDSKFIAAAMPLKPGWVRFPGGTVALAYDWNPANPSGGHINVKWMNSLITGNPPRVTGKSATILAISQQLTQAKGGVYLSDFAAFANQLGAAAIICFNGFTDTNPGSASQMVLAAQSYGLKVLEWELANEAYLYPSIYPSAGSYADAMYAPYFLDILGISPTDRIALFSAGQFTGSFTDTSSWDGQLSNYTPRYWNAASTHIYPLIAKQTAQNDILTLNGILAHGSTDYINSYLAPLVGPYTPIYVTELNCCAQPSDPFLAYLYNGLFLVEYIARLSSLPNVQGVGVNSLYTDNSDKHGLIQSVDDFEGYLIGKVIANPDFATNTASNPNTQFQFYTSAPGLAIEVANRAINGSTHTWHTDVLGGLTIDIMGYDGQPIPSVFAQAYRADDGTRYLLITNKAGKGQNATIVVNGTQMQSPMSLTYVTSAAPLATNTAQSPNNVQIQTRTAGNPIFIGPYSVTCVTW